MQYTLDSITHVVEALKETNRGSKIDITPVYITDLSTLSERTNERLFYGVLTVYDDMEVNDYDGNAVSYVSQGEQLTTIFASVTSQSLSGEDYGGQFRGYEITVKGLVVDAPAPTPVPQSLNISGSDFNIALEALILEGEVLPQDMQIDWTGTSIYPQVGDLISDNMMGMPLADYDNTAALMYIHPDGDYIYILTDATGTVTETGIYMNNLGQIIYPTLQTKN